MLKFHNLSFLIDNHSQLHKFQFTKNFCDCNGFREDWTYSKIVCIDFFDTIATDASKPFRVSLLKIEPWSHFFRQYKPIWAYIIYATVKSLWKELHLLFSNLTVFRFFTLILTFILKCLDTSSHLQSLLAKLLLQYFLHKKV